MLLLSLSRPTRDLWYKLKRAFITGLENNSGRRTLEWTGNFTQKVADYFTKISNPMKFVLYDYVISLKNKKGIKTFCEFIRGFDKRDKVKFKRINVYYTEKMSLAVLNSPYCTLQEYNLDCTCIQINHEGNFMPSSDQDTEGSDNLRNKGIIRYSHTFELSCFNQRRQDWMDEMIRYDWMKRVTQLNLWGGEYNSLEDLGKVEVWRLK